MRVKTITVEPISPAHAWSALKALDAARPYTILYEDGSEAMVEMRKCTGCGRRSCERLITQPQCCFELNRTIWNPCAWCARADT